MYNGYMGMTPGMGAYGGYGAGLVPLLDRTQGTAVKFGVVQAALLICYEYFLWRNISIVAVDS